MTTFSTSSESFGNTTKTTTTTTTIESKASALLFYPSPDRIMMERLRLDDDAADFVYIGQVFVPDGVIHVRVHPSIKVIRKWAFFGQTRLISVDLHDGLEVIGVAAFKGCAFEHINIPSSVRAIEDSAFWNCSELTTAILNNGLEEIGSEAFSGCALEGIVIPPSVRVIKDAAFADCW